MGRNVHCEVWPGCWVCVLHAGGQLRSWAFPWAWAAPGSWRGCSAALTSADGAPGAPLAAQLRPTGSALTAGSARELALQGHTESCEEQSEIQPQPSQKSFSTEASVLLPKLFLP